MPIPAPSAGQPVKLFVGGLPQDVSDDEFRQYFAAYGALSDCTIMRDSLNGTSRGFGFVVFESGNCAQQCLGAAPHTLHGKVVDAKLAVPRDRMGGAQPVHGVGGRPLGGMMVGGRGGYPQAPPRAGAGDSGKVFVGGLAHEVTQSDLVDFFSQFGPVSSTMIMTDRATGRSRGFGFVTFADAGAAQTVLQIKNHAIQGKMAEVKPAVPRGPEGGGAPMGMGGMMAGGGGGYGGYPHPPQGPGYGMGGYSGYAQAQPPPAAQGGYAGYAPPQQPAGYAPAQQAASYAQPASYAPTQQPLHRAQTQQLQGYAQQPVQTMQPQQATASYTQPASYRQPAGGMAPQQTGYASQPPQQQPQQQVVPPQQQQQQPSQHQQQYGGYYVQSVPQQQQQQQQQQHQQQQPAASLGAGQYGAIAPHAPQQQPQPQYAGYTGLPQTTVAPIGYSGYQQQAQQQPQGQGYGVGYDASTVPGSGGQMGNRYTPY